ncbi:hypothetical protein EBZ35_08485 [bacterium]|nr:hypothetical protein [bacterium]
MTHRLLPPIGMLALFSPLILWGQNQSVDGFSHPMIQLIETSQGVGVHQSSLPQVHQVHLHADGTLDDTPPTGSHPIGM